MPRGAGAAHPNCVSKVGSATRLAEDLETNLGRLVRSNRPSTSTFPQALLLGKDLFRDLLASFLFQEAALSFRFRLLVWLGEGEGGGEGDAADDFCGLESGARRKAYG